MEEPSKKLLPQYIPNGFIMGNDGVPITVSAQKRPSVETNCEPHKESYLALCENNVTVLPKSYSTQALLSTNGQSQTEPTVISQSPQSSLRLALSTDCLSTASLGCLSPLTPTSRFHKRVLSNEPSSLIIASVLCNWNNIFGPKVRCLWITEHERHADLTLDLLNYVANQTLSGEVMHDPLLPASELKLYILADKGVVLATLVFGAEGRKDLVVHSLSIIVPHSQLQQFFVWKDVCVEWMQRAVQHIRIELTKDVDRAYESFQSKFLAFIRTTETAIKTGFPRKIELRDTMLHPHHVFDAEFLRKAIAAHLIQCQQSIVIGRSANHINLMINTLSLFMSQHRRHRCQMLTEDGAGNLYSPEFCIQGLLSNSESLESALKLIYCSRYPTALIDVDNVTVWMLSAPNEYPCRKRSFVLKDLSRLLTDSNAEKPHTLESLFEPMTYHDTIVNGFLKEFHCLPLTHGVRETYVRHFMSSLQRTALSLIQLTEAELRKNSLVHALTLLPKLRQTLSLKHFCDLMIVICVAELLKPGMMETVCGDEQKLHRLMP